jgi:hypothetical protein
MSTLYPESKNAGETKTIEVSHNQFTKQTAQIVYGLSKLHASNDVGTYADTLLDTLKYGIERYTLIYSIEQHEQIIAIKVESTCGKDAWYTNNSSIHDCFAFDYCPIDIPNIKHTTQRCKEIQRITRGFEHVQASYMQGGQGSKAFSAMQTMIYMGFDNHKVIYHKTTGNAISLQVSNSRVWCLFDCDEFNDLYQLSSIAIICK